MNFSGKLGRVPAITIENIAGTYQLSDLTVRIGLGPEESIYQLFMDDCENDRLIRLDRDHNLYYIKKTRKTIRRTRQQGTWELSGNNSICIDGDVGIIKKFDGSMLVIATVDENDFETTITATYTRYETLYKRSA